MQYREIAIGKDENICQGEYDARLIWNSSPFPPGKLDFADRGSLGCPIGSVDITLDEQSFPFWVMANAIDGWIVYLSSSMDHLGTHIFVEGLRIMFGRVEITANKMNIEFPSHGVILSDKYLASREQWNAKCLLAVEKAKELRRLGKTRE